MPMAWPIAIHCGIPRIEARVGRDGAQATFSLRDHGLGIPEDRQDHLFERFYRAHAGTPEDYVAINTEPWTRVTADQHVLGLTPVREVRLPAGAHRLTFENPSIKLRVQLRLTVGEEKHAVHRFLIVHHGITHLENLYLEELAAQQVYEFLLIAAPLRLQGATGSWVHPIAIA